MTYFRKNSSPSKSSNPFALNIYSTYSYDANSFGFSGSFIKSSHSPGFINGNSSFNMPLTVLISDLLTLFNIIKHNLIRNLYLNVNEWMLYGVYFSS